MNFEIGKYYKHTTGKKLSIIGEVETVIHGNALIAEDTEGGLSPVGKSEDHAVNFIEITQEEWMENIDTGGN